MRAIVLLIPAAALFLSLGCAHKGETPQQQPAVQQQTQAQVPSTPPKERQRVIIRGMKFNPTEMVVRADTEVIWSNEDGTAHAVSSPGLFDSGAINPGASFSFRFMTPGRYAYSCSMHPGMAGTVVVQ